MPVNADAQRLGSATKYTWSLWGSGERAYVLRLGGVAIGSLRWLPGLATVSAHAPQGCHWLLDVGNVSSVIVRAPGDATPFAHLAVEPRCSVLTTREGLRFEFRPNNLLATRWMIEDQDKHLRVDFRGPGLLSEIVIHAVARVDSTGLALLPLALVTGGYLMAKMVDDLMITIAAASMQG